MIDMSASIVGLLIGTAFERRRSIKARRECRVTLRTRPSSLLAFFEELMNIITYMLTAVEGLDLFALSLQVFRWPVDGRSLSGQPQNVHV
jgi:hypothetical protein